MAHMTAVDVEKWLEEWHAVTEAWRREGSDIQQAQALRLLHRAVLEGDGDPRAGLLSLIVLRGAPGEEQAGDMAYKLMLADYTDRDLLAWAIG